jgi:hypothetical protein
MRTPEEWADITLGAGVTLLLGWRNGRRDIAAQPVNLDSDVGSFMLGECLSALVALGDRRVRPYSGVPAIEGDEFLSLPLPNDVAATPAEEDNPGPLPEETLGAAELVELARNAFGRTDFLTKGELQDGSWLFYAVIAQTEDGDPVAFVKQYNPQRGFKTSRLVTAYANTLTRFEDPVFNWDFGFDVIMAPDEIAVLRITAFERVFSDLDVLAAGVPDDIANLADGIQVSIGPASLTMLVDVCQGRATLARQLKRVAAASHLAHVTQTSFQEALLAHGLPANRFGNGTALEVEDDDAARALLDMLEGRYYEGDFSGEHRRADRYSPRP